MKRDMDLVRQILLWAEAKDAGRLYRLDVEIDGYDHLTVAKHVELMQDRGLVEANVLGFQEHGGAFEAKIERITWDGYEFLDLARNTSIWTGTMDEMKSRGVGFSIDVAKAILIAKVKAALGISD